MNSDLVIALSWYEPFGMIAAQVAALGKPVIVSKFLGANKTLNQYKGLFIAQNDNDVLKYIDHIIEKKPVINEKYLVPDWGVVCVQINEILKKGTLK